MELRISGIKDDSVVDGTGIRMVVFTQGCPHHCEGCHNPQTHDFNGGKIIDTSEIISKVKENPLLDGITFSGGEPFAQPEPLSLVCDFLKENKLNAWCYTGYTLEQLNKMSESDENVKSFLSKIDTLVDGRFEQDKLDLKLKFRGSSNQRIINMNKTREQGKVVLQFDEEKLEKVCLF